MSLRNASDRYELTLKLFGLAHLHRPIRRLVSQAAPLMRDARGAHRCSPIISRSTTAPA